MNVMQKIRLGTRGMERGKILADIDGDLWVIADANHHLPDGGIEYSRRIVACVNACDGVDNETLEKIASGEMDGSEIIELVKLKKAVLEFIEKPIGLNKERMRDLCI